MQRIQGSPRDIIDGLVLEIKNMLGARSVDIETIADNEDIYDVQVALKSPYVGVGRPNRVTFSYDKGVGYFLDIDNHTLEFDKHKSTFIDEAKKYIIAIHDGRVHIKSKPWYVPRFMTMKGSLYLQPADVKTQPRRRT